MAITAPNSSSAAPGSNASIERADPTRAKQKSAGDDRPGFDLGGAKEPDVPRGDAVSPVGSNISPSGAPDPVPGGTDAARSAHSSGMTDGAPRGPGGPVGGSKAGEATQASPGAVRPPQSTSADQSFTQGNPDDAA